MVCEEEEFQADRAVVTLPLGVLKAGQVEFHPTLPKRKLAAIAALGVAAAHKVVLRFPRRFWDNETDFLGSISDDGARFVEWTDLSRTTDSPILSLWSHGRAARELEKLDRAKTIDEAMTAIRRARAALARSRVRSHHQLDERPVEQRLLRQPSGRGQPR